MSASLNSGVTGLRAHQTMLDVIGNNLANVNTHGFKAGNTLFADLVYQNLRSASAPTSTGGGVNPAQVGFGVGVAQVAPDMRQGDLELTGNQLDFAIEGDGYFTLQDNNETLYTRAGSFALDASGRVVDPATGYQVLRFGTVGEPSATAAGFQTPGDSTIQIPLGALVPGNATQGVAVSGNLAATTDGPVAEVLLSEAAYTAGGTAATGATLLNSLDNLTAAFVGGDTIDISGTAADGSAVSTSFAVGPATTLQDLVDAISAAYPDATATLDNGTIQLTADAVGPASLSLTLANGGGNTGALDFSGHGMETLTDGSAGGQFQTSVEVYDNRGARHSVTLVFEKTDTDVWSLQAALDPSEGTVVDGLVSNITFNENGSIDSAGGAGLGDTGLTFQFAGTSSPQTITLNFGTPGGYEGITHLGATSGLTWTQDGFPPGTLTGVTVDSQGKLIGTASNGRSFDIAQLAVATFRNPSGLTNRGGNYLMESTNSGTPMVGQSTSGSVRGQQLEKSNVDIAGEFTRMIVAQRGFAANARTITVSDQVLQELLSIVR